MSIVFSCNGCGRQFSVPESMAGTQAQCNTCGNLVQVPSPNVAQNMQAQVLSQPGAPAQPLGGQPLAPSQPVAQGHPAGLAGGQQNAPQYYPEQQNPVANPGVYGQATLPQPKKSGLPIALLAVLGIGGTLGLAVAVVLAVGVYRLMASDDVAENGNQPESQATVDSHSISTSTTAPSTTTNPNSSLPTSTTNNNTSTTNRPPSYSSSGSSTTSPSTSSTTSNSTTNLPSNATSRPTNTSTSRPTIPNLAARQATTERMREAKQKAAAAAEEQKQEFVAWSVQPDPPQVKVAYKAGRISIPFSSAGMALFPTRPSNFVLITEQDRRRELFVSQVHDLRTLRPIGSKIEDKFEDVNTPMFSPDGRYLVGKVRVSDGAIVRIWSFVTGALLREIMINDRYSWPNVTFAGPHQLLTFSEESFGKLQVKLFNMQDGTMPNEFTIEAERNSRYLRKSFTVSPGGRYAAMILGKNLAFYELSSGQCVGMSEFTSPPRQFIGMAFSPDGLDLAAMLDVDNGQSLFHWNLSTGELELEHAFQERLNIYSRYDGPPLEWALDKSGVLYKGTTLLDVKTGEKIWTFPDSKTGPRQMVGLGRMIAVMNDPRRRGRALSTVSLPADELQSAIEAIHSGGKAIDSVLPPASTANVLAARYMQLPNGFVDWNAPPDAAGEFQRATRREMLVGTSGETIKAMQFGAPDSGGFVVQKYTRSVRVTGRHIPAKNVIHFLDVNSGAKGSDIELPNVYELLAVSPSGKVALVGFAQRTGQYDRLDLIQLAPKKHLAGWRPYEGEEVVKGGRNSPHQVTWAAVVDDTHVLTVNMAGKLIAWELPDCNAKYIFSEFGTPFAISANRKYLAGVHNDQFRVFDSATGNCVGDLESPTMGVKVLRAAFRRDGKELAAVIDGGLDLSLVRWNLETGKLDHEFPIPPYVLSQYYRYRNVGKTGTGLEWRGDRYLLLDNRFLIDVENRAVVWQYYAQRSQFASNCPDNRTWIAAIKENTKNNSMLLKATETPSATTREKIANIRLEDQLVMYPGMSVRLSSRVGAQFGVDETQVIDSVTQALELRGIVIDQSAPVEFSVVAEKRATGETLVVAETTGFGFPFSRPARATGETVAHQRLVCMLKLKDASGKVRWEKETGVSMRSWGTVKKGSAAAQLDKEMKEKFSSLLSTGQFLEPILPMYVFADEEEILGGASMLTFDGEVPPPPKPTTR